MSTAVTSIEEVRDLAKEFYVKVLNISTKSMYSTMQARNGKHTASIWCAVIEKGGDEDSQWGKGYITLSLKQAQALRDTLDKAIRPLERE